MYRTRANVRDKAFIPEKHKVVNVEVKEGPENIFEKFYYDTTSPSAFAGAQALKRQLKGIKTGKEIDDWLKTQRTYTLHKPVRKNFKRNTIFVTGVDDQFQADLADVSMLSHYNGGVHFLLTCIDVFSKYAWAIPMKNKTAVTTRDAFREIFAERKPNHLVTDRGKEFENSVIKEFMAKHNVNHFFALNPDTKASIAERFNRTLKGRMWKYLTHKNTLRYLDVLKNIVNGYNNSYHRSIKMTPVEASEPKNTKKVERNLYGNKFFEDQSKKKFKFELGDHVRISKERNIFKKGYRQGWSKQIFRIAKRSARDPVVYKIETLLGEPIAGSLYEIELQKVSESEYQ